SPWLIPPLKQQNYLKGQLLVNLIRGYVIADEIDVIENYFREQVMCEQFIINSSPKLRRHIHECYNCYGYGIPVVEEISLSYSGASGESLVNAALLKQYRMPSVQPKMVQKCMGYRRAVLGTLLEFWKRFRQVPGPVPVPGSLQYATLALNLSFVRYELLAGSFWACLAAGLLHRTIDLVNARGVTLAFGVVVPLQGGVIFPWLATLKLVAVLAAPALTLVGIVDGNNIWGILLEYQIQQAKLVGGCWEYLQWSGVGLKQNLLNLKIVKAVSKRFCAYLDCGRVCKRNGFVLCHSHEQKGLCVCRLWKDLSAIAVCNSSEIHDCVGATAVITLHSNCTVCHQPLQTLREGEWRYWNCLGKEYNLSQMSKLELPSLLDYIDDAVQMEDATFCSKDFDTKVSGGHDHNCLLLSSRYNRVTCLGIGTVRIRYGYVPETCLRAVRIRLGPPEYGWSCQIQHHAGIIRIPIHLSNAAIIDQVFSYNSLFLVHITSASCFLIPHSQKSSVHISGFLKVDQVQVQPASFYLVMI
ncbi:hypothetical protein KI387_019037, partial [Taxus chinensis]